MKKIGLIVIVLCLSACGLVQKSDTHKGIDLQKVSFSNLSGFDKDNLIETVPAFRLSCEALQKNPNLDTNSKIKLQTDAYLKICKQLETTDFADNADFRNFLVQHFQPYLITDNGQIEGKYTSYYEAEIKASKTKHGKYQYPIYGRPNDLIEINLHDFDQNLPNKRLLGRIEGQKLTPYLTRQQIEEKGVDAPVILWGDDKRCV